ncbi:hypothetical protein ACFLWC_04095 [Chloroflexota bacterium]
MASSKISLVFPKAEEFVKEKQVKAGVKLSDIRGKKIALVDDGRINADAALAALDNILVKDYGCETLPLKRPSHHLIFTDAETEVMFEGVSQTDAAVIAMAS